MQQGAAGFCSCFFSASLPAATSLKAWELVTLNYLLGDNAVAGMIANKQHCNINDD